MRQHSEIASEGSLGPCLAASNDEIQENLSFDETIPSADLCARENDKHESTTDLSLVPKVCYSCPSCNSDSMILSASYLKTVLAIDSFAPRGMPESHSTIMTLRT